jgi:HD-like signal output (HDOD) protein
MMASDDQLMSAAVQPPMQTKSTPAQEERKRRLQRIIRKGLPPFPQTALELTKVLGASPDLQKAGRLISADPTLSSQVLRMCNSPIIGLRSRVISIEQATVLLGAERLRNLAITSSMIDFARKALPEPQMDHFWQHSFMAAMLTQYLAQRRRFFEKDQAYIAGLLHDIGQVPQWMLVIEDKVASQVAPAGWVDNPRAEREYFGIDHCELGNVMGGFWDFLPSFLDVLNNHHTPELAKHNPILVRIVATIECFLLAKDQMIPMPSEDLPSAENVQFLEEAQKLVQLGEGLFGDIEWRYVEEALEGEYTRMLPLIQTGLKGVLTLKQ